jgi:molecular chaperone Hsp33
MSHDIQSNDSLVRAITDDGAFRVITALTTDTVRAAIAAQKAEGVVAERFADVLTGAVIVRETMSPGLRVQGLVKGARGSGRFVADSYPDGATRGLVSMPEGRKDVIFGEGALLQMMRTLPNGTLHTGIVEVPEETGISGALMQYMHDSEQIFSVIAVGALFEGGEVKAAGGFIVQLLPEVKDELLMVMTERLRDFTSMAPLLRASMTPDTLLDELLFGMPYTKLETRPVRFECQCSEVRVIASLGTLSAAELQELIGAGEMLHIGCDYCGKNYEVQPETLRGLLEKS